MHMFDTASNCSNAILAEDISKKFYMVSTTVDIDLITYVVKTIMDSSPTKTVEDQCIPSAEKERG
jgi:hypothetical protein